MNLIFSILDVIKDLPLNHIVYTLCSISIVSLFLVYSDLKDKSELNIVDKYCSIFPLIFEIIFQVVTAKNNQWHISKSLPLEFSYITSLSLCLYTINHSVRLDAWIFFAGFWSSAAAFLNTIMIGNEAWYINLRYYGHHSILLYFGARCIRRGYRPNYSDYLNVIRDTILIILIVGSINYLINSNYMFTNSRPPGANFSRIMPDWPIYFLLIVFIGFLFYTVLFIITKRESSKK